MKITSYSLLLAAAACGMAHGQTAYTSPVGYVTQSCAANSDTIVGLPLRIPTVAAGALSTASDTTTIPGSAILTLSGTPGFTVNAFQNTHYVKISSGTASGNVFVITANTANTLTIALNGVTLNAVTADTLDVVKFWTLADLFNPTTATIDPLTTPHAIVASTSTAPAGRRTELLIPDYTSVGNNKAPSKNFYINAGIWKQVGQGATSFDTFQLWPDSHFIIRNPLAVTSATSYVNSGQVDSINNVTYIATDATSKQDSYMSLVRPVDLTLNQLGLGATSAFVDSISSAPSGRRDEILIYDNSVATINKSPSANYYYFNSAWRKVGQAATSDFGTDVISAGSGFVVRKYQTATGATAKWNNLSTY